MAQSCLEIRSIEARHTQIVRSDYQKDDPYWNVTADIVTEKDLSHKGTNTGGHGHWLPDCHAAINNFNYSNFNTDATSTLGNKADYEARRRMMARSLYNAENPYGSIDTSANVLEGQYVVQ